VDLLPKYSLFVVLHAYLNLSVCNVSKSSQVCIILTSIETLSRNHGRAANHLRVLWIHVIGISAKKRTVAHIQISTIHTLTHSRSTVSKLSSHTALDHVLA